MKTEHENLLDEFIGNLDFDDMLKWLDLMEIDNEPPPIDDTRLMLKGILTKAKEQA